MQGPSQQFHTVQGSFVQNTTTPRQNQILQQKNFEHPQHFRQVTNQGYIQDKGVSQHGKAIDQVQFPHYQVEQTGYQKEIYQNKDHLMQGGIHRELDPHSSMVQEKRLSTTYFKGQQNAFEHYPHPQQSVVNPSVHSQQQNKDIPIIGKIIEQVPINIIEQAPKTEIIEVEKPIYIEKQVMVENKEVVDQYRHKVSKLEIDVLKLQQERNELANQMESLKNRPPEITYVEDSSKLREMEDKVNKLVQEIKQLTQVLEQKSDESEYWKKETEQLKAKCMEMESQLHEQNTQHQMKSSENTQLHEKVKRGAHAHKVLTDQHSEKDKNITQLETALHEQESKIIQLSGEITRLQSNSQSKEEVYKKQIEELSQQIVDWQNKHKNIEMHAVEVRDENSRMLNENQSHVNDKENLERDSKRLSDLLQMQTKESKELKEKCNELHQTALKVAEYENKMALLTQELQRFQMVLKNKSEEGEKYHSLLMQSELKLKEYEGLESDNKRLSEVIMMTRQELDEYKERLSSVQVNFLQSEKETNEYKNKFAMLATEIEHQKAIIGARDEDVESWKQRYVQLQQSYISAKEEISQNANLQNELSNLKLYLKQHQDQIEEHKNTNTNLEISHREQTNKTIECERQVNLLTTQLQYSEKKIQHTDAISNAFREEIEKWKDRYSEQETKLKQLDGHCSQIQSEFQHLQSKLQQTECIAASYKEEVDKWKDRHCESETNAMRLAQEKNEHQQASQLHQNNSEQQRISLQSQNQEINQLKQHLQETSNRLHSQDQEIQELQSIRKQYEQIQVLYNQRTEELKDQHEKYIRLERSLVEYRQFEAKVHQLSEELSKLKQIIESKDAEIYDLRNRHSDLQQSHDKLVGNEEKLNMYAGQIEHLMDMNKQKDEDLDVWRYKWYEHSKHENKVQELLQVLVLCFAEIECLRKRVNEENTTRNSQFCFSRNQSNFMRSTNQPSEYQSNRPSSDLNFKQFSDLNIKSVTTPSPNKSTIERHSMMTSSLTGGQMIQDALNSAKAGNSYQSQRNAYQSDINYDNFKKK